MYRERFYIEYSCTSNFAHVFQLQTETRRWSFGDLQLSIRLAKSTQHLKS